MVRIKTATALGMDNIYGHTSPVPIGNRIVGGFMEYKFFTYASMPHPPQESSVQKYNERPVPCFRIAVLLVAWLKGVHFNLEKKVLSH